MDIKRYDSWKLHTPDNDLRVYTYCEHCKNEIYFGDEYYDAEGDSLHFDCVNEYAVDVLNPIRKIAGRKL